MTDVFVTRRLPEAVMHWLEERLVVECGPDDRYSPPDILRQAARDARALISWLPDRITRELLDAGSRLRIVANYGAGTDNIDVAYARSRGIFVTNTPDVLADATADIAMGLMLGIARQLFEAERFVREGRFRGWEPQQFLGNDLRGKRLGLYGMGSIGRAVARRALGFGMELVYHNRSPIGPAAEAGLGVQWVPFDELVASSDFISLHCPLTSETRHRFTRREIERMKDGVYFINTARGAVVCEADLVAGLRSGKIAGAGLDVYEFEPEITAALFELPNVMLLPHIGSATVETRLAMARLAAENVVEVLAGRPPRTPV